ncbi:hypothetical protein [Alteribacillus sp. YIM 98480]|uniref:hypothetical protein n=1 Tax=Alteribacillus sp. YIM 98480 TaxID=2606599 RepID=UPI00131D83C2|nr:hypothetical protein [Alteribacillus sp. YIM 98480]
MSSASAYSLEIPSVRQWKAKISFPYAAPPGLVAREQGACAFLSVIKPIELIRVLWYNILINKIFFPCFFRRFILR